MKPCYTGLIAGSSVANLIIMRGSMPYKEHPELKTPDNPDAKIWRYLDFTKFLSMLEDQSLFFCRLDVFAEKDPYEGLYTNLNARSEEVSYSDFPEEFWQKKGIEDEKTLSIIQAAQKQVRPFIKQQREMTFVNSWCVSEHESAAMWPLYIQGAEGIAVQSTFNRLIESMKKYEDFNVFIGEIKYLDYNTEAIPPGQILLPLTTKRKSFEHEKELRALIWTLQHGKNKLEDNKFASTLGLSVPINLDKLIESIYVSPTAAHWFLNLIKAITKRYEITKPVIQSDLLSNPLY